MRVKLILLVLGLGVTLTVPMPAAANVIANVVGDVMADFAKAKCVGGVSIMSPADERAADSPITAAMVGYWAVASERESALVNDIFDKTGKAAWVFGDKSVDVRTTPVVDPYARTAGSTLVHTPMALVRGRWGEAARGVWEVKSSSGDRLGLYLVDFVRRSGWRPHRLELLPPEASVPSIKAFCETPGDVEAFHESARAIPETQIAKLVKKASVVATCVDGQDCSSKWARAKAWIDQSSVFPIIRDTESLLLTSGPIDNDLNFALAVTMGQVLADGRREIRLRAWCGNWITCISKPETARNAFISAIQ